VQVKTLRGGKPIALACGLDSAASHFSEVPADFVAHQTKPFNPILRQADL